MWEIVTSVLTVPLDADFTEYENFPRTLSEPDYYILPSLSAALTLKHLVVLEIVLLIGTDLVVCKLGRWFGVRHSNVKVVQILRCKMK